MSPGAKKAVGPDSGKKAPDAEANATGDVTEGSDGPAEGAGGPAEGAGGPTQGPDAPVQGLRPPTREEHAVVTRFFDAWTPGLSERLLHGRGLGVLEKNAVRRVTLCSPALLRLPDTLLEGADHGGLPIGTLEEDGFRLDLQGAVEAARHTEEQSIRVREKSAHLFVYGRDILGDSILRADRNLRRGDFCLVLDPRGEALGIGTVVGSFKGMRSAVRPVHDLGAYLREQDRQRD